MKPTPETLEFYNRARTLTFCVRGYADVGQWADAQRVANTVRDLWVQVRWQS